MRRLAPLVLILTALGAASGSLGGQVLDTRREIAESRLRLEEIRAQRASLQAELEGVRGGIRDAAAELGNIERQISASRSVVAELALQLDIAERESSQNALLLASTRKHHLEASAVLHQRLREAYKLGPLHTVRFLLGADSFTGLLNRYRYIQMLATYDRALLQRVARLEADLRARSQELQMSVADLSRLRQSRLVEVARLSDVEAERQSVLDGFVTREREALSLLESLAQDQGRMQVLLSNLEARRLRLEALWPDAPTPDPAQFAAADLGTLAWPVEGEILYRFGLERRPDGTQLRWNGLGIAAQQGTPVRAVRPGTVMLAGPLEGYGLSVIVSHGEGYYTLYLRLEDLGVVEGRIVERGEVVGTVGGAGTPEGPRLEFQMRTPGHQPGAPPEAVDPLPWLRPRP